MNTITKFVVGSKIDSMKKSMGFDDEEEGSKEEDKEVSGTRFENCP